MISFTNQEFLDKRAQYAKWGSYVGFAALGLGLVTTNRNVFLAYAFLLVGMLAASLGSFFANRYVREPRADQALGKALGALDKRFTLYNYYLASNHIIASHHGLTIVEPRSQNGPVTYDAGRWKHKAGFRKFMQIFGEPSLGKPDQDLAREIEWVRDWIDEVMPGENIPVNGAIVFTNDEVELSADDAPFPTLTGEELAEHMRSGFKGQDILTTARQKELRRALDAYVGEPDEQEGD